MSYVETETFPPKVLKMTAEPVRNDTLGNSKNSMEARITKEDSERPLVTTPGFKSKIVWFNAIGFLILHLAALYSIYLVFFKAKVLTPIWAYSLSHLCGLAITLGAHRMYTHKAFKANVWVRLAVVVCHTIAGQNCLWVWIRDHRQHHKYCETDADPHNSNRGFFFSHIGWLMMKKHKDVITKGKTVDMSDIEQDVFVMLQKRFYKSFFVLFTIVIPTWVPCYFWGESLWNAFFIAFICRLVLTLNITWLVNSAAHMYGTRPFSKDLGAVENSIVSFLALGEGWHNYHHTFPWDYRAAEYGQYLNHTTKTIDYFAKKGWVYDVKSASEDLVRKHSAKYGDGSHPVYGKFTPDDWVTNTEHAY